MGKKQRTYEMTQIFSFLTLNNDGSTFNMAVNGSITPQSFELYPSDGEYLIERILIHIEDNANISVEKFGALLALTNGIKIQLQDDVGNVITDFTSGNPVKSNGDWGRFCYDTNDLTYGAGNNALNIRWTLSKSGEPTRLTPERRLIATVSDDLTGLVDMTIHAQGVIG